MLLTRGAVVPELCFCVVAPYLQRCVSPRTFSASVFSSVKWSRYASLPRFWGGVNETACKALKAHMVMIKVCVSHNSILKLLDLVSLPPQALFVEATNFT